MRRPPRWSLIVLAIVPFVAGGFILESRETRESARVFDQVLQLVAGRFVDTVQVQQLYERAARGLVKELKDPYTELLAPKDYASFSRTTGGRYGGIGMLIEDQNGRIIVSRVFPHTPAEGAGVREGDRIIQIDTASTSGWKLDQVSNTLLGTPGTRVTVKFTRPGVPEAIETRLTRAIIRIPAVYHAMRLDGDIGYITLQQFNETAAEEVADAIRALQKGGAKSFILDLRDNPGGILPEALDVSSLFLKQGQSIASVRGRAEFESFDAQGTPLLPTAPLVVLTDAYSASASEIVAGALQDHDRALIVGTTTFGKGVVQTVFPLDGGWYLKMTTAKWFTPSGRSIQKERKVNADGRLIELPLDSMESDSARRARPQYRSDAGRIIYGGGAITPDVIVRDDTLTKAEQEFARAIAPKSQRAYVLLHDYAIELKAQVKRSDYAFQRAWHDELYQRLDTAGVFVVNGVRKVDRAAYDAAARYIDRELDQRIARYAFGDTAAKRRDMPLDRPLQHAAAILRKGTTQQDLFVVAKGAVKPEGQ